VSQQINLFNPIFLKQKKIFAALTIVQALGVLVLGMVAMALYANYRVNDLERRAASGKALLAGRETRLVQATAQFAPRQKSATLAAEITTAEAELANLHQVESVLSGGALGNTAGYAEYFRAFARQNVNGLWLTGLSIVGAGNDIGVDGRAMQATLIPNYIARLSSERIMHGKTFANLQIGRPQVQVTAPAVTPAPAAAAAPAAAPSLNALLASALAPAAAAAAEPAVAPTAPPSTTTALAPYVEFHLQSQAAPAEEGK
jgi:hypothetical protein